MKKIACALLVLLLASLACGVFPFNTVQGSGKVIRQSFEVDGVDHIDLKTPGRVELVLGDSDSLVVETDDNIMPHLKVKVQDGTLILDEEEGLNLQPSLDIIYRLSLRSLASATVNSSGTISAGTVQGGSLELHINGSGRINFDSVDVEELKITSAGSGDVIIPDLAAEDVRARSTASGSIQLSGAVTILTLESNGSGDALLADLQASEAKVQVHASGAATVWALDDLDVQIDGSGDVFYYGTPAVTERVSGSGRLVSLGGK